ncbi:MAG: glutamate racemase, partial [Oscillospiraceae bacterium]
MDNRAIGVFDSGLGGLTATRELSLLLPGEHIIYLGDSQNMPYGEKSREQIIALSLNNLKFLLERDVKAVFVACGTATSNALSELQKASPVPVFGVVEPAAREAVSLTKNGKIGILATRASVAAGAFDGIIKTLRPELSTSSRACPKFATMVEDGIVDKDDPRLRRAADEYLPPLKNGGVDTVILGCTHYPLLADIIGEYMGADIKLISAGAAAARSLSRYLQDNGLTSDSLSGKTEYFTTGDAKQFAAAAARMLGGDILECTRSV